MFKIKTADAHPRPDNDVRSQSDRSTWMCIIPKGEKTWSFLFTIKVIHTKKYTLVSNPGVWQLDQPVFDGHACSLGEKKIEIEIAWGDANASGMPYLSVIDSLSATTSVVIMSADEKGRHCSWPQTLRFVFQHIQLIRGNYIAETIGRRDPGPRRGRDFSS